MKFRGILFFILLCLPFFGWAQDTAQFKKQVNYKQEIVINDKRYRVWDNWVNFGAGAVYNSDNPRIQLDFDLDFNFHITKLYFDIGGFVSGDGYGLWNNYEMHAGYVPYRKQTEKWHIATVFALSYSQFHQYAYAGHYYSNVQRQVGVYGEFQWIRKVEYTTGGGPVFFFDVNKKQTLVGIRLNGYLSGAYRGYVKGKEPKNKM